MNRILQKTVAAVLASVMVCGLPVTAAAATPVAQKSTAVDDAPTFTTTADLIERTQRQLFHAGKFVQQAPVDEDLVETVETESGYSYDQVTSALTNAFFFQRNGVEGSIDTAYLNLSRDDMAALMEDVIRTSYLSGIVQMDYQVDNGIVTGIDFSMRESYAAGLDSILNNFGPMEAAKSAEEKVDAPEPVAYSMEEEEYETVSYSAEEEEEDPETVSYSLRAAATPADARTEGGGTEGGGTEGGGTDETHTHSWNLVDSDENTGWVETPLYWSEDYTIDGAPLTTNGEPYVIVDPAGNVVAEENLGNAFDGNGKLKDGYNSISTVAITYDYGSKTFGVQPALMTTIWTCTHMTLVCEDESCGQTTTVYAQTQDNPDGIVTSPVTYDDAYFAEHPEDLENQLNYGSTIFSAVYTDENGKEHRTVATNKNATKIQLMKDWGEMCNFNAEFPQYFGTPAPYWTSKNGEASPMDAIKWLCNMNEELFVPDYAMQYMVAMLNQAFMSYVWNYSDMVDAMLDDAMKCVSPTMTDIQIYLVLHDWLAKYATFDMQSLVNMTSTGDSSGIEPIGMTVFGTLLSGQDKLEDKNGGICLGYAATYTWLIQSVFQAYDRHGFEEYKDFRDKTVVDFAQIKYLTNVAESSVASGGSGFGDGDSMFNSVHYFNAVRLIPDGGDKNEATEDMWYYVDVCYDDISTETTSQMRVETDGNISHGNFMISPVTMEEQYEGNFQYIDSLYDGVEWARVPYFNKNGQFVDYYYQDENGTKLIPAEAENYPGQVFYYYERYKSGSYIPRPDGNSYLFEETSYDDDTYEQAWFSKACSEVIYDKPSGAFYYVETQGGTYTSMKDITGDDDGGNNMFDNMSPSQLLEYQNDPAYADKLRARPIGATDVPAEDASSGNQWGGFGQSDDEESIVIFHYGFGTYGKAANDSAKEHSGNMGGFGQEDQEYEDSDYGPFRAEVEEDKAYHNMYPDLIHSLAVNNGVIYFNLGNKIFAYTLGRNGGTYKILNNDKIQFPRGEIAQLKEYTEVTYGTDGRPFTGMSFSTDSSLWNDGEAIGTLRYHPISSLSLKNQILWQSDEITNEDGSITEGERYRDLLPTLYVSIGTNFSNSYKGESGEAYTEEAVNYNPAYLRFMDTDDQDNENTNTEFMWCANVVDKMVLDTMLNDKTIEEVTVESWCGKAGFTEQRSVTYGLSDGTTKTELESDPADYHDYEIHPIDNTLVCTKCLKPHDATIEQPTVTDNDGNEVVDEYIDTHLHTLENADQVTFEWYKKEVTVENEDGATETKTVDACRAKAVCEEEFCDHNTWHECTVVGEGENAVATIQFLTLVEKNGQQVNENRTYSSGNSIPGDVNRDGSVNGKDVMILCRYNAGWDVSIDLVAADVNRDGSVNGKDVMILRRYNAGWDVELK